MNHYKTVVSGHHMKCISSLLNRFFDYKLFYISMYPSEYILKWDGKCPLIAMILMGKGRTMINSRAIIGVGCPEELEKIAHERRIPVIIVPPPCPKGYVYSSNRWCLKRFPEYSVARKHELRDT